MRHSRSNPRGQLSDLLMVTTVLSVSCWNDVTVMAITYYQLPIANIRSGQPTQKVLYNCGSWEVSKSVFSYPDNCHQRHLRSILGIRWPHTISNELLYRRCDTRPLSETVTEACWRMLGHVLHVPSDTPAQLAMQFALEGAKEYKGRCSRHQTNLLETI